MGSLADAYVDVKPNLSPLHTGLGQAKASLTSFASAGTAIVAKGLAFAGVAAGIGGVGASLFQATMKAADLSESLSKVNVTFGGASRGMIDQADDLARKFGVVKKEALDAGAGFGLMGVAAGLSKEKSAALGREFVQLGLDLASYHNLSNAEAFTKLRAGLAGEQEPLRVLGIMLSEDAIKAEAFSMGLVKVKRDLTDQEKIMARASLIKRQAGPAAGDLERTADSAKNQWRKLQGEVENFETTFGEKLIPALTTGIEAAHELAATFQGTFGTGPVEAFADAVKGSVKQLKLAGEEAGFLWREYKKLPPLAQAALNPAAALYNKFVLGSKTPEETTAAANREVMGGFAAKAEAERKAKAAAAAARVAEARAAPFRAADAEFAKVAAAFRERENSVATLRERTGEAGRLGVLGEGAFKNLFGSATKAGNPELMKNVAREQREASERDVTRLVLSQIAGTTGQRLLGLAGVTAGVQGVSEAPRPERPKFSSELMSDPEDYARRAIQSSLDSRNDPGRETVEKLEAGNKLLETIAKNTAAGPGPLAIARGVVPRS